MKTPKRAPPKVPKPRLHPYDAAARANGNRPYAQELGKVIVYVAIDDDVPENMKYIGRVNVEEHGDLANWVAGPSEDLVRERAIYYGKQVKAKAPPAPKPDPIKRVMVSADTPVAPPPPPRPAPGPFKGTIPGQLKIAATGSSGKSNLVPPAPKPPSGLVPPKKI